MAFPRKTWRMILCAGTAFLFFAQLAACSVDSAGLIPCEKATAEHHHEEKNSPCSTSEGCHSCISHLSVTLIAENRVSVHPILCGVTLLTDETATDGPAREIDHPPQLS